MSTPLTHWIVSNNSYFLVLASKIISIKKAVKKFVIVLLEKRAKTESLGYKL
jgi:hypothetical protein